MERPIADRSLAAQSLSSTLGTWTLLLGLWSVLRLLALHRFDEFGMPPWFDLFWLPLAALMVVSGVAHRRLRSYGRVLYCVALFVGLVGMTQLEQNDTPGRFWSHIVAHLVLAWWLWSPVITHALAPDQSEAPTKAAAPSHVHLAFGGLLCLDVVYLVHQLGAL